MSSTLRALCFSVLTVMVAVPCNAQDTAAVAVPPVQEPAVRPVATGGVRIRSRNNSRPKIILRQPETREVTIAGETVRPYEGLTRADLDRMTASIVQAIRALQLQPQVTVVSPPAQVPAPVVVPQTRTIRDTVYVYVSTPPDTVRMTDSVRVVQAAPPPTPRRMVEEIERAFLDTGIFRSLLVNFEFGRSTLLPSSDHVLSAIAEVLKSYPDLRIRVSGHTDYVGSDEYNLKLSQDRAQSVVNHLVTNLGISSSRLVAEGFGEGRPMASNASETGRALNRRVEFEVLNPESAVREQRRTVVD